MWKESEKAKRRGVARLWHGSWRSARARKEEPFVPQGTVTRHCHTRHCHIERYKAKSSNAQASNVLLQMAPNLQVLTDPHEANQLYLALETYHLFDPTSIAGYVQAGSLASLHNVGPSFASDLPNYPLKLPSKRSRSGCGSRDQLSPFYSSDGVTRVCPPEDSFYPSLPEDLNRRRADYAHFDNNYEALEAQKRLDRIMGDLRQLGFRQRMYAKGQLQFVQSSSLD
jgi:hypothetical protein